MQQLYILFCLRIGLQVSQAGWWRWTTDAHWGDNCCRNNCSSTGKLPEFTQYSYINVMRVVGVVDSK